ncbi:hypothetical protein ACVWU4_000872 [Campylobacter coli]
MLLNIFNLFKPKTDNNAEEKPDIPVDVKIDKLIANNSDDYPIEVLTPKNFDKNKPSILIVDDNEYIKDLYEYDFKQLDRIANEPISSKYNIIYALGDNSGMLALQYIVRDFNIKIALLDLTLAKLYNIEEDTLELDGVDLAIALEKYLPNTLYRFLSAHNLEYPIGILMEYLKKASKYLNRDLAAITINKSIRNKEEIFLNLIKEYENGK